MRSSRDHGITTVHSLIVNPELFTVLRLVGANQAGQTRLAKDCVDCEANNTQPLEIKYTCSASSVGFSLPSTRVQEFEGLVVASPTEIFYYSEFNRTAFQGRNSGLRDFHGRWSNLRQTGIRE